MNLYRRIYSDVPELPPLDTKADLSLGKVICFETDLSALDNALRGGAAHG